MCGIVGFTGNDIAAAPILLDGLRRLEYRGYDSSGAAFIENGRLRVIRSVGKVAALEARIAPLDITSSCGIAHTRWATHGAALEKNAHPHTDDRGEFAVVHNGIIENYRALRRELESRGRRFASETDSEVIPMLISELYDGDLPTAVASALRQLKGTFGIAVICAFHPGMIVSARAGSPVILGVGNGCNLVASDASALASRTQQVIYLNDGEMAVLTPEGIEVRDFTNSVLSPEISLLGSEYADTGRGDYEHFMLKEIFEQPDAVRNTLRGRLDPERGNTTLGGLNLSPRELADITRIVIAGCGSSLHAGLIGKYYIEDLAGIPAAVEQAAEFRYRNPIIEPHTMVVPISQSGETADTLAAVHEAVNKGAVVAAISNVVGSTIARTCARGIYLHAGPEISVASTKAFNCQLTALLLLAIKFARNRRLSHEQGRHIVEAVSRLPELIGMVLEQAGDIRQIAEKYAGLRDFFFIGRGTLYPVALEGALKLKEISYVHAEGYHAAELKHGPISQLGPDAPVIAMANRGPGYDKLLGNIEECAARLSPIIAVVNHPEDAANAKDKIVVPECGPYIAPMVTVTALQLFAYYFAKARGCEIDQPRNLAKSVTVE